MLLNLQRVNLPQRGNFRTPETHQAELLICQVSKAESNNLIFTVGIKSEWKEANRHKLA